MNWVALFHPHFVLLDVQVENQTNNNKIMGFVLGMSDEFLPKRKTKTQFCHWIMRESDQIFAWQLQ